MYQLLELTPQKYNRPIKTFYNIKGAQTDAKTFSYTKDIYFLEYLLTLILLTSILFWHSNNKLFLRNLQGTYSCVT